MRVVFAGTPEFALAALRALRQSGFDVPFVLTQPDRPAGRGLKLHASVVKTYALEHCIALAQPRSLRLDGKFPSDAAAAREALLAARPDVMVVAAYGLLLPPWVLELPRLGCVNIHASLLPRWRGAAPIHRAIEAGDAQTGITIMQMDTGLDTGANLLARSVPIRPHDSTAALHDRLAELGGQMIVTALQGLRVGELKAEPQAASGVSYAHKIDKAEAPIDWNLPAEVIERRIRAFDPFPGASSELNGETLKCWHAELLQLVGPAGAVRALPGQILTVEPAGVTVACGHDAVRITELQRSGGKRLPAGEFLTGHDVKPGMRFGAAAH